jgi:hydrogenase 3 maturation protease
VASTKYNLERELEKWLDGAEKVVVAGIGNPIRMDDFVGVRIAQELRGKVSKKVCLIECETVPESFIQQITDFDPSHILLIDAAILELKPGESRLVETEKLANIPAFSTHTLPLRIFCEYLAKTAKARIGLLLMQPEKTDFGEGLTRQVDASVSHITRILRKLLP